MDELGYEQPTEIQKLVFEKFNNWKHIVWQSQTGTWKTAAFLLPILQNIDFKEVKPQVLILAPTRELATQIREEIINLSKYLPVKSLAVYGGSNIFRQRQILSKSVHIVVWTPWRVIDLIDRWFLDITHIKYFVLDEVDRMLDMWFVDNIDYIWSKLSNLKQTMTFSATFPEGIKKFLSKYLGTDYEFIKVSNKLTVDNIDHWFVVVPHFEKIDYLLKWLNRHNDKKIIIFAQTKRMVWQLLDRLNYELFKVVWLHGDMTQRKRFESLELFKKWERNILVATDVASRGLNMNDVDLVINFDVPIDPEAYIHRIWRTWRAWKSGKAVMMVTNRDERFLWNIEKKNKIKIKQLNDLFEEISRNFGLKGKKSYFKRWFVSNRRNKSYR